MLGMKITLQSPKVSYFVDILEVLPEIKTHITVNVGIKTKLVTNEYHK